MKREDRYPVFSELFKEECLLMIIDFIKGDREYRLAAPYTELVLDYRYLWFYRLNPEHGHPYEHVCRISMFEPRFMGLEEEHWIPDETDIKNLMEYLQEPVEGEECLGLTSFDTRWRFILYSIIKEFGYSEQVSLGLPLPDYYQLSADQPPKFRIHDFYVDTHKDHLCFMPKRTESGKSYYVVFPCCNKNAEYFGLVKEADCIDKNSICWISMIKPEYLYRDKGFWIPDKNILKDFIESLTYDCCYKPYFGDYNFDSYWELLCTRFENEDVDEEYHTMKRPMPDYKLLLEK